MQSDKDLLMRAQAIVKTVQQNQLRKYRVDREAHDGLMDLTYEEVMLLRSSKHGFRREELMVLEGSKHSLHNLNIREELAWWCANVKRRMLERSAVLKVPASIVLAFLCAKPPKEDFHVETAKDIFQFVESAQTKITESKTPDKWRSSIHNFSEPHDIDAAVFKTDEWKQFHGLFRYSNKKLIKAQWLDTDGLGKWIGTSLFFTNSTCSIKNKVRHLYFQTDSDTAGIFYWTKDASMTIPDEVCQLKPAQVIRLPEFNLSLVVGPTGEYGRLAIISACVVPTKDQSIKIGSVVDSPLADTIASLLYSKPQFTAEFVSHLGLASNVEFNTACNSTNNFGVAWGKSKVELCADREMVNDLMPEQIVIHELGLTLHGKALVNKYNRWQFNIYTMRLRVPRKL